MPDGALTRCLFGKLPAHGDFVSRGMDAGMREQLDRWLTVEMEQARAAWDGEFERRYDVAPVWHFVDEADNGGWSGGILCASADRVGRRFPLIFAASAPDCASAVSLSAGCLMLVGQGFAEGWDADRMVEAPLAPESLPWQPTGASWALVGGDGPVVQYQGRTPTGVIERMLEMAA